MSENSENKPDEETPEKSGIKITDLEQPEEELTDEEAKRVQGGATPWRTPNPFEGLKGGDKDDSDLKAPPWIM
ncbi:MAG: hypothetical protein H7Y30_10870 [Pyrinomonadaceae bacterium]|nr:hypothetical protein [Pyrinomonadaceae bacterium]